MLLLKNGAILIDTPGMRELQLWSAEDNETEAFSEIEQWAADCRYADCTHSHEAGCAVLAALEAEELSEGQYQNYLKMQRELRYLEEKQSEKGLLARKAREKQIHRHIRKITKHRK
jgi:ribosome biogenesis GTPase